MLTDLKCRVLSVITQYAHDNLKKSQSPNDE